METFLKDGVVNHLVFSPQEEDSKRFIIDEEASDLDLVSMKIHDNAAAINITAHLRSPSTSPINLSSSEEEKKTLAVGSIVIFKKGHEPNLDQPAASEPEATDSVDTEKALAQLRKPAKRVQKKRYGKKAKPLPEAPENLIVLNTKKRDLRSIEQKMLDMKNRKRKTMPDELTVTPIPTARQTKRPGAKGKH